MQREPVESRAAPDAVFDVLIVGAGLSGIGAAWHLQRGCTDKTYAILEARAALGGTWDLFRYPGVRSDSDMYTLGYGFRPWTAGKAIADGAAIRDYIAATARAGDIERHIRYDHKVVAAHWDSAAACWTVTLADGATLRARLLHMCSGYYSYGQAYRPRFDGEDDYAGRIVQPQFWPPDLAWAGKRVVVVGSGATAVTLVPALAQGGAQVTMLQRSPSWVVSRPSEYGFAARLRRCLPARAAYALTRWRVILESTLLYRVARSRPQLARHRIAAMARRQLGRDYDVATHFTPAYDPWDQRVCVVPDGDLFEAIRSGRAEVVTDRIARFTSGGLVLASGRTLAADIVVLATGLTIELFGGMALTVDGRPFDPHAAMSYKGMMLSDLPNCVLTFGYTNASWTLKADLTAAWTCRLLRYMDRRRLAIAVPRREAGVAAIPFLDFTSGYVQRARDVLPQRGARRPWQVYQNYFQDMLTIRYGRMADGVLRFGRAGERP